MPSRRTFAARIQSGHFGGSAATPSSGSSSAPVFSAEDFATLLLSLPLATSVVATDYVPTMTTGGFAQLPTAAMHRTFVLGITGGNASIPEPLIMGGLIRSDTNNTDDLGTTGVRWKDGWFAGTVTAATGTFTTVAGTLSTAAQGNVTSLGTLTSLVIGAGSTTNALIVTTTGAIQSSFRYDASNRLDLAVSSTGQVTLTSVPGTAANELITLVGRLSATSSNSGDAHRILRSNGSAILEIGQDTTDFMRFSLDAGSNTVTWRYGASGAPTASFLNILMGLTLADSGGNISNSNSTAMGFPAGETGRSPLRLPHGSAPTSPVDGDVWTTTAGLFVRINGSTVGPLS